MAMTQEQVAHRARVSTATVSRVLNNKGAVGSARRVRVLKAVEELKYNPNLDARGLAAGSRSVGVIVSNFENPFFLDIYKVVEAGAGIAGFEITMANTGYSPERLTASVRLMIGRRARADRRAEWLPNPDGVLRRRHARKRYRSHPRELPAWHGKANRLSPQPGASSRGVCGASHDLGKH
jgi:transcriptional regulator with XRE-family HTH domain